ARVAGATYVDVPRGDRFEIDPNAVAKAVELGAKLILVASPNNPTGNATPIEIVRDLLALAALVVVDEAYFKFSVHTAARLFTESGADNLIVLRTFSKWAGLAGLRLGYGIFPPQLVSAIERLRPPYSISQAAEVAGLASLDDLAYLRSTVARILDERRR